MSVESVQALRIINFLLTERADPAHIVQLLYNMLEGTYLLRKGEIVKQYGGENFGPALTIWSPR